MLDRSRCVILLAIISLLITINTAYAKDDIHADENSIQPFTISFSTQQLSDLHTRLTNGISRMSSSTLGGNKDWTYGTNPTYLTSLVNHWIHNYNWTARQERINHNLPQFTTVIDGLRIHFVHVRSSSTAAFPLLFSHGWPGSYLECEKILPLLTKADADLSFHVVCPSIPGYAFSSPPQQPGMDARGIAHIFHKLMLRLGYSTYYGQGGDWGSVILTQQAYLYPTHLLGLHINFLAVPPPLLRGWGSAIKTVMSLIVPSWFFSEKEVQMIRDTPFKAAQDFAYMAIQGTKPQTLGFALNDSPIGLASWLSEKYHAWTDLHDAQGDLNKVFSYDEILDFIMIYWISGSISTSMRLYYEMFHSPHFIESARQLYVSVPVGVAEFKEIIEIPRSWAEYYYNIVHWNPQPRGGHFAALEQPTLLVDDLRQFIRTARDLAAAKDQSKHEL